jgi:trans-aconitate methyltransferase
MFSICNGYFYPRRQKWNANQYQEQCGFVWAFGAASLLDFAKITKDESILDVGCGSGELTEMLRQKTGDNGVVIGIDSSPTMIEKATSQFKYNNMQFIHQDIRTLTLPDPKQFDLIFSNAALHWIPQSDIEQAIQSMAHVLKLGGRFVCELGGIGNIQTIVSACHLARHKLIEQYNNSSNEVRIGSPVDDIPWYFPSVSEFTVLLEKYGIEVLVAELYDRPTPLVEGEKGLRNWITMFGQQKLIPSNLSSSDENHQLVLNQFFQQVEDIARPTLYSSIEQKWITDYRRLRVVGVKKSSV